MIIAVKATMVLTSLAAAVCWFIAFIIKAPEVEGQESWVGGAFDEKEGKQVVAHAKLQNRWNALAAAFATAAAVMGAIDGAFSLGWL
jgi:hypothetical protein